MRKSPCGSSRLGGRAFRANLPRPQVETISGEPFIWTFSSDEDWTAFDGIIEFSVDAWDDSDRNDPGYMYSGYGTVSTLKQTLEDIKYDVTEVRVLLVDSYIEFQESMKVSTLDVKFSSDLSTRLCNIIARTYWLQSLGVSKYPLPNAQTWSIKRPMNDRNTSNLKDLLEERLTTIHEYLLTRIRCQTRPHSPTSRELPATHRTCKAKIQEVSTNGNTKATVRHYRMARKTLTEWDVPIRDVPRSMPLAVDIYIGPFAAGVAMNGRGQILVPVNYA
ncbi:hypothetical protein K458DRAFT_387990 [Lentithecium fluviatile CBS 122367]|uniref:Uncharacterized protein n=1 Tax=Lentithecium fluviatile CBS 122367 TaxID=1168545 RepID=A0A6G1J3K3_9PLEO|nr:hypothetical protein K458DRAFT_387990 [Lentithecium fluviatile CBS 122367]